MRKWVHTKCAGLLSSTKCAMLVHTSSSNLARPKHERPQLFMASEFHGVEMLTWQIFSQGCHKNLKSAPVEILFRKWQLLWVEFNLENLCAAKICLPSTAFINPFYRYIYPLASDPTTFQNKNLGHTSYMKQPFILSRIIH